MKINKTVIAAGVGLLAFVGVAISQPVNAPQVQNINPTDLMQVIPLGQPKAQSQYALAPLVTAQYGYKKLSPASTQVNQFTFAANQVFLVVTAGETVANLSITLAAAPNDGARECIFSPVTVTALTILAGSASQTLHNAATSLTLNTGACYSYSANNLTWDRS